MKTNYSIANVVYDPKTDKLSYCCFSKVVKLKLVYYARDFSYRHLFGRYNK